MNNIDKVYVLNHKDFDKRREFIENQLKSQNIKYELVQKFHPSEFNYEEKMNNWEFFDDIEIVQTNGSYRNFSKKISVGSLSLILKHIWCYEDQIKNNFENVLILEDDANIPNNFNEFINNNMQDFIELKKKYDVSMLMLGKTHSIFTAKKNNDYLHAFYNENQKTRCTHAYVLNINATKKLINGFKNYNLPIDFKINEIIQKENIKVAWSEPGITQVN